ncbi:MAG: response regulator [Actinobacteria bacterium]|nr:response regulator [Actinomycetota bacterium]
MSHGARQILVVDDNTDVRELIVFILDEGGYRTLPAKDGPSALALINEVPVDLVLLDVMMPAMSGIEVLEDIRQPDRVLNRDVPVVMISAMAQNQDLEEAMAAGANSYVVKPFRPHVLLEKVAELLGGSKDMKELVRS